MTHLSRLLILGFTLLIVSSPGFAQQQERPNRPNRPGSNMSPEDWKEQQVEAINRKIDQFMKKMGDLVPEEKKPRLQQFVQIFLVEELKIRMEMMANRQKVQGNRQAMQKLMADTQGKIDKLKSQAHDAAMKLLDDKKAFNAFKKNLEAMSPNRAQGGRPGQGGQGGGQGGRGSGSGSGGGRGSGGGGGGG
jgi:hypothetical protein